MTERVPQSHQGHRVGIAPMPCADGHEPHESVAYCLTCEEWL